MCVRVYVCVRIQIRRTYPSTAGLRNHGLHVWHSFLRATRARQTKAHPVYVVTLVRREFCFTKGNNPSNWQESNKISIGTGKRDACRPMRACADCSLTRAARGGSSSDRLSEDLKICMRQSWSIRSAKRGHRRWVRSWDWPWDDTHDGSSFQLGAHFAL